MNIIDCDRDPFVPEGYSLVSHEKGGHVEWIPTKDQVRYYRVFNQRLDANVLWFLLEHPDLIPDAWGTRQWWRFGFGPRIFFRGTFYKSPHGHLSHLYLYRAPDGSWCWDREWLDYD